MKKTPAQLQAHRKYYDDKVAKGYTQLNVLVKEDIVSTLKQYAKNNDLSIQKALSKILKKGLDLPDNKKDPWSFDNIRRKTSIL